MRLRYSNTEKNGFRKIRKQTRAVREEAAFRGWIPAAVKNIGTAAGIVTVQPATSSANKKITTSTPVI